MNYSIPELVSTNSSLPPFSMKLLGEDMGRLAPLGLFVVALAVIAVIVWLNEQRVAGKERRSVKRGS